MGVLHRTASLTVLLYLIAMIRPSIQVTCSDVVLAPNTILVSSTWANNRVGTNVTLACQVGYVQDNNTDTTGTCMNTATTQYWAWSPAQLTCSIGCSPVTLSANTIQASPPTANGYATGTRLTLACQSGYYQNTGTTASATCVTTSSGKAWNWDGSLSQLTCSNVCSAPDLTSFQEQSTTSSSYAISDIVSVSCINGYSSLIGNSLSITCTAPGLTWTPPLTNLNCQPDCLSITPNSRSSQVSPPVASSYAVGTQLTMACNTGYGPIPGTAVNATCSNGQWIWGDGNDLQLDCAPACATPAATVSKSYVTTTNAVYIVGTSITAQCNPGYSYSSGSYTRVCTAKDVWTWNSPGALTCLKTCTPPQQLPVSLKYVSSMTAIYMVGDTFTIGCNTGYGYSSGSESAQCSSDGTWTWNGGSNLTCIAACTPPVPGAFSSATAASTKSLYLLNDVINYVCNTGYMYNSGATTGTCVGINTWSWSNAAIAPQVCIIIPKHLEATSGLFSNGTCDHYVLRPAVTDATCLISCVYDDYCDGYALVGTKCYHERSLLASAVAAMTCQIRQ